MADKRTFRTPPNIELVIRDFGKLNEGGLKVFDPSDL